MLKEFVSKALPKAIEKVLDERLPSIIDECLMEKLSKYPYRQLNAVGFRWALALSLREMWPDVKNYEAVEWLEDYINTPYGTPGYDWSFSGAKTIALEYVNEVGEVG